MMCYPLITIYKEQNDVLSPNFQKNCHKDTFLIYIFLHLIFVQFLDGFHMWHYVVPNPVFNVRIMGSNRGKCKFWQKNV